MKTPQVSFLGAFREIGRNAFVDWLLILILNILIMVVLILGGVYLYWEISTGHFEIDDASVKKDNAVFNEKDLKIINDRFQLRKDNASQARAGYRGVSDPSL